MPLLDAFRLSNYSLGGPKVSGGVAGVTPTPDARTNGNGIEMGGYWDGDNLMFSSTTSLDVGYTSIGVIAKYDKSGNLLSKINLPRANAYAVSAAITPRHVYILSYATPANDTGYLDKYTHSGSRVGTTPVSDMSTNARMLAISDYDAVTTIYYQDTTKRRMNLYDSNMTPIYIFGDAGGSYPKGIFISPDTLVYMRGMDISSGSYVTNYRIMTRKATTPAQSWSNLIMNNTRDIGLIMLGAYAYREP